MRRWIKYDPNVLYFLFWPLFWTLLVPLCIAVTSSFGGSGGGGSSSGRSAEEQSCIDRGGEWLYGGSRQGYYCDFTNLNSV